MRLFSAFQSLWSSCCDTSLSFDSSTPSTPCPGVNVDGTPMASDWLDVCGKPYGVADFGGDSLHNGESSSWSDATADLWTESGGAGDW